MSSVTFPTAIGGDGSTVTDDDNATTGLRNGGWRTRFIPCFTNLVNIADYIVSYTAQTSTFAVPPPMGSTTPNTGAFTRVTVTGSTVPVNGLYLPAANSLGIATNSTERVRIDASGRILVGATSNPNGRRVLVNGTGSGSTWISITDTTQTSNEVLIGQETTSELAYFTSSAFGIAFAVGGVERSRFDTSGNLLVGQTSASYTTLGASIRANGAVNSASASDFWNSYSIASGSYRFYVTNAGTVYATNTTIAAISDKRLKENIQDLDVGLASILALKPRKFDWKAGKGKDIKGDRGFIAQEFELVFPDLVDTWKDEPPEGEEPYKSVRQDLIPVIVRAIQELAAELNELKKRIN